MNVQYNEQITPFKGGVVMYVHLIQYNVLKNVILTDNTVFASWYIGWIDESANTYILKIVLRASDIMHVHTTQANVINPLFVVTGSS